MQWLTRGRGRGSRGWQACPATLRDSAGHSLAHPLATRSALRKGGGAPRRAAVTLLVTAQEGKGQSPRAGANPGRARTAKRNSLRDRRVGMWKRHGHKRDGRGERGGGGGNGANNRPLVDEVSETVPSVVSCTAGPTPPVASVGSVPARRHTTSAVLPSIDGLAGGNRRWWQHSPRAIVALAAASAARCSCAQLGGAAPCWDDPPPHAAAAAAAAVCRRHHYAAANPTTPAPTGGAHSRTAPSLRPLVHTSRRPPPSSTFNTLCRTPPPPCPSEPIPSATVATECLGCGSHRPNCARERGPQGVGSEVGGTNTPQLAETKETGRRRTGSSLGWTGQCGWGRGKGVDCQGCASSGGGRAAQGR